MQISPSLLSAIWLTSLLSGVSAGEHKVACAGITYAFFTGIDAPQKNCGIQIVSAPLQANVKCGLPAGNYRICSIASGAHRVDVKFPAAPKKAADCDIIITSCT